MTDEELTQAVAKVLCSYWSSKHEEPNDFDVRGADRVLAAIRASGRLAPEVPKDMLRGAAEAIGRALLAPAKARDGRVDPIGALVPAAEAGAAYLAPLIAAAAEAKAREECARIADEAKRMREELFEQNGASINAARAVQAEEIAAAIRTGAAS